MFTLRTIPENGCEINNALGDGYVLVRRGHQDFDEPISKIEVEPDRVFAFIKYGYSGVHSLEDGNEYYIMTGSGQTYAKISRH